MILCHWLSLGHLVWASKCKVTCLELVSNPAARHVAVKVILFRTSGAQGAARPDQVMHPRVDLEAFADEQDRLHFVLFIVSLYTGSNSNINIMRRSQLSLYMPCDEDALSTLTLRRAEACTDQGNGRPHAPCGTNWV